MSHFDLLQAARDLADELRNDIDLAKTREEHIRVTARANAARELASALEASPSA